MNKKLLVTNGCSWVYGDKLKNPKQDNFVTTLGKNAKFKQIQNLAIKKGSNRRISRTTIHWLLEHQSEWDDMFVLIGWTGAVDRPEFFSPFQNKWIPINNWNIKGDEHIKTDEERQDRDMAEKYYAYHWSELSSFQDYFNNVILLQNFLKSNNIDYYFFRSFAFEDPYTRKHYGYNSVVQAGLDVLKGLNPFLSHPSKHEYSDEEIWSQYVDSGWLPKNWKGAIDLELFPSFVNYNRTFQHHIQDNKRSDGMTFREVYPTHPNKQEHDIWAKQIQKEIEEL
jgi:hypothetical protein